LELNTIRHESKVAFDLHIKPAEEKRERKTKSLYSAKAVFNLLPKPVKKE